jgi:hypothetical protein
MFHLLLYALIALAIPFLVGYPMVGALRLGLGLNRLILGLVFGLAVLIVLIRSLQCLYPVVSFAWPLAAACALATLASWTMTGAFGRLRHDLRWLGPRACFYGALAAVVAVVALNLPTLSYQARAFEGTGNHDSFHYVVNARYMQEHSFYPPVEYSPQHPIYQYARTVFGQASVLGRVGAEGYLAWLATLLRRNPVLLYNALSTAGVLAAALASLLFLSRFTQRAMRSSIRAGWVVPAAFLAPAMYFASFNSNYSNIYGMAFLVAYLAASGSGGGWRRAVASTLLWTALLATYSELAPIALACLGLGLLMRWRLRKSEFAGAFRDGLAVLRDILCSFVLFPWIATTAWHVIRNSFQASQSQGATMLDIYAGLSPAPYVLAFLTTCRSLGDLVPAPLAVLILCMLAYLILRGIRQNGKRQYLVASIGVVFLLLTASVFVHSFNYGKVKVLEYFCPFIVPTLLAGSVTKTREGDRKRRSLRYWHASSVLGNVVVALLAIGLLANDSLDWGKIKRITPDFLALADKIDELPQGSLVAVGQFTWPYYYSMWLPYLSKATFLFSEQFGGGGYLSGYVKEHPYAPITAATYLAQERGSWIDSPYPKKVVGTFGNYELLDLSHADTLTDEGLYQVEGTQVWMGPDLQLTIQHRNATARYLNIFFAGRFSPAGPTESVQLNIDGHTCIQQFSTQGQGLSLALDQDPVQRIEIRPLRPAISPQQIGMNADTRELTYLINKLEISADAPRYKLLNCAN